MIRTLEALYEDREWGPGPVAPLSVAWSSRISFLPRRAAGKLPARVLKDEARAKPDRPG